MEKIIKSTTQMQTFARTIARSLKGGEILLLQGPLGSGKTTFVKALARALGIKKTVVSPTFTLCHEYTITPTSILPLLGRGRKRFFPSPRGGNLPRLGGETGTKMGGHLLHLDCYRLKSPEEFLHLGALERIGEPDTIAVIEWPEKIKKYLPRTGRIVLRFSYGEKTGERVIQRHAGVKRPACRQGR